MSRAEEHRGSVAFDGTHLRRLTRDEAENNSPAWSPDGRKIAFDSAPSNLESARIYVMNADGSDRHRLTRRGVNGFPSWSPNGREIAFVNSPKLCTNLSYACLRNTEIYVMNADGSNEHQLTRGGQGDLFPRWSPDGRKIAFQSHRTGTDQIYVMNADGSNQHALTHK